MHGRGEAKRVSKVISDTAMGSQVGYHDRQSFTEDPTPKQNCHFKLVWMISLTRACPETLTSTDCETTVEAWGLRLVLR